MLMSVRGAIAATLLAGTALAATPALADDAAPPSDITVTGSASVASQYRFRGIAQSDNKPVVQGSITVSHKSGFYLSTWGSSATKTSVDYLGTPTDVVNIGGTEIDVYGGWTGKLGGSGVTLDAGGYGYIYPGMTTGNYYEVYGSLAYGLGPVNAKVGVNFAPAQKVFNYSVFSPKRSNTYVYGELGGAIPNTPLTIHTHLGHTGGGFDVAKQYIDYTAGITYAWHHLSLDASIVGTNIKQRDFANTGLCVVGDPLCNAFHRVTKPVGVVTLTASF